MILSGVAALGGLAWFLNGGSGGPDASREVAKPPALVYSEFAGMFTAGSTSTTGLARNGRHTTLDIEVKKSVDRSIDYRIALDGKEALTMSIAFESIDGGRSTRINGDLDVEQALVRFAASQGGTEPRHMPDFAVNWAMNEMVEKMALAVEEGRPLDRDMLFPLLKFSS